MGLFDSLLNAAANASDKKVEREYNEMSKNSIKSRANEVAQKNGYKDAQEVINKNTNNK